MSTAPTITAIPLVDLKAQHDVVANEIAEGWQRVIERCGFIGGEEVATFEESFAAFSGARHCIGVGNGTDALELALRALDVGPGDEVIVPANSFIASALAVLRTGATPVLVDVDPATYLIREDLVVEGITSRTRVIMPVHLYGQIAPVERLMKVAESNGIAIVEDAAQAQGARRRGMGPGSFGELACTSFYPGKNLGAYGDAGAVLTSSDELERRVRALGNHGSGLKYEHAEEGYNSRLDALQAVVLNAKLMHLERWNEARRAAADRYNRLLADLEGVSRPAVAEDNEHVFHLYVVRVPGRDHVWQRLNERGIGAGVHYPVPIHLQGAMHFLGHREGDFPVTEEAAEEILSLPMFPGITPSQQERVVDELGQAIRS